MSNQTSLFLTVSLVAVAVALAFPNAGLVWLICGAAFSLPLLGWLEIGKSIVARKRTMLLGLLLILGGVALLKGEAPMRFAASRMDLWRDRARLQRKPAVFPYRVKEGRPQRVYVSTESNNCVIHWKGRSEALEAVAMGPELRYIDLPSDLLGEPVLEIGSQSFPLKVLRARVSPDQLHGDPAQGLATTVSEETDECILVAREGRVWKFPCLDSPTSSVVLPGKRVAVGGRSSRRLSIHGLEGELIREISLEGGVEAISISQAGDLLAVLWEGGQGAGVDIYTTTDWARKGRVDLPDPGEMCTFSQNGQELYVASRRGLSLSRLTQKEGWSLDESRLSLARPATALCLGPEGKELFLTSTVANISGREQLGNHYISETLHSVTLSDWSWSRRRNLEGRTSSQDGPGGIDSGCGASSLAFNSRGELLVAFSGTHEIGVEFLDERAPVRFSLAPSGLYCPNSVVDLGGDVYLVSLPAQGVLAFLQPTLKRKGMRVAAKVWLEAEDEDLRKNDPLAWLRRQGEIGFYESTRSGVSCQSCHTRGDSDFARHEIGGGTMWGTLSCLGVAGTGPYLRNGGYPGLSDLHSTSEELYRGYLREAPVDRRKALKAYLESLPGVVNPRWGAEADLERLRRGEGVFRKSKCRECHAYPAFTNLSLVQSASLFPGGTQEELLDVPSLLGVWRSAPFLHDNRAADLRAVIEDENPDDIHGHTKDLTENEKSDLIYFLESL